MAIADVDQKKKSRRLKMFLIFDKFSARIFSQPFSKKIFCIFEEEFRSIR